jgi:hypothetical protein
VTRATVVFGGRVWCVAAFSTVHRPNHGQIRRHDPSRIVQFLFPLYLPIVDEDITVVRFDATVATECSFRLLPCDWPTVGPDGWPSDVNRMYVAHRVYVPDSIERSEKIEFRVRSGGPSL